jgi:hypothetical protein
MAPMRSLPLAPAPCRAWLSVITMQSGDAMAIGSPTASAARFALTRAASLQRVLRFTLHVAAPPLHCRFN